MNPFDMALDHRDWDDIRLQLDAEGYALLPGLLGEGLARELAQRALASTPWRGALGASDLLYFDTGLPTLLEQLRDALYRRLVVPMTGAKPWGVPGAIRPRWGIFWSAIAMQARQGRSLI
jgi:hypothetical protein